MIKNIVLIHFAEHLAEKKSRYLLTKLGAKTVIKKLNENPFNMFF